MGSKENVMVNAGALFHIRRHLTAIECISCSCLLADKSKEFGHEVNTLHYLMKNAVYFLLVTKIGPTKQQIYLSSHVRVQVQAQNCIPASFLVFVKINNYG